MIKKFPIRLSKLIKGVILVAALYYAVGSILYAAVCVGYLNGVNRSSKGAATYHYLMEWSYGRKHYFFSSQEGERLGLTI